MDINKQKDALVTAVRDRFKSDLKPENRYVKLVEQIADLGSALESHLGNRKEYAPHNTPQHLIAAVLLDLFMLAEYLETDIQKELDEAIYWLKNKCHTPRHNKQFKEYIKNKNLKLKNK